MKCDAKAGRTMSDSRAVPKNSLETLNRLREATRRVCVMMPPPSAPLPMDTAANQKVAFEALNLHAANLKFLRHCRVDYGNNPYTNSVFRAIEQWARLAPAEKAKDWMPWASYLVDSREHDSSGFNADFLSWGGQLDDWIGQCAGEGAAPAAAIAKARSRAPRNLRGWANSDSGTFAVVITDIVDSVKLRQRMGDCRMKKRLDLHFAQAACLAKKHDGNMFKNTGDGVLALFRTASGAVKFALALEVKSRGRFRIRAGIDVGPVVGITSDDCSGSTVDFTQRVMSKAKKGGVVLSDRVREQIKQIGDGPRKVAYEKMPGMRLKGLRGKHTLWQVKRKPLHGKQ